MPNFPWLFGEGSSDGIGKPRAKCDADHSRDHRERGHIKPAREGPTMKAVRAAVVLGVSMFLALSANPAWANDFQATTTGARANWTDVPDRLTATDTAADGDAAVAQLRRPNGTIETVIASGGSGTSNSQTFSGITEDAAIEIRACRRSGGVIVGCGSWVGGFS
jgi:hypothetical protein